MISQTPKFAAAFTFALLVLVMGYLSTNTGFTSVLPGSGSTTYVAEEVEYDRKKAEDRPIRNLRDLNNAFVSLAESTTPAVVTINTERTVRRQQQMSPFDMFEEFFGRPRGQQPREREFQQRGQGSGVIVSADGIILTNHHVIANADTVTIRTSTNRVLGAKVLGSDPDTDVAVLQVDASNLPYLELGDSDNLRVGEWVMAVGSPLSENLAQTVTQGIVSAKGRSNIELVEIEDFIQTDAAINPGNSGGPLVNMDGELIGINTAIASRSGGFQGIGFAIPINMASIVMDSILDTGRVSRSFLGISGQQVNDALARALGLERATGAIISQIIEDSPAEKAGLKEQDVILEYNGRPLESFRSFQSFIASRPPGYELRLKVLRDDEQLELTAVLAERESEELVPEETEDMLDRFGFSVEPFTDELANEHGLRANLQGVIVKEVRENSQAQRQGIRPGDLISAVNRQRVRSMQEFTTVMQQAQPGSTVLLQVVRRNQQFFVAVDI